MKLIILYSIVILLKIIILIRFGENKINYSKIKFKVITNGCEQNIFKNEEKVILNKVKIVTHHWRIISIKVMKPI